ncbi:hypothetical protein MTO96_001602 [Rhipicephalus appendiculatus]
MGVIMLQGWLFLSGLLLLTMLLLLASQLSILRLCFLTAGASDAVPFVLRASRPTHDTTISPFVSSIVMETRSSTRQAGSRYDEPRPAGEHTVDAGGQGQLDETASSPFEPSLCEPWPLSQIFARP